MTHINLPNNLAPCKITWAVAKNPWWNDGNYVFPKKHAWCTLRRGTPHRRQPHLRVARHAGCGGAPGGPILGSQHPIPVRDMMRSRKKKRGEDADKTGCVGEE